jgi:hypothetical protein
MVIVGDSTPPRLGYLPRGSVLPDHGAFCLSMEQTETKTELTQKEIVRAATNDAALAEVKVKLGDKEFPILDLPYDDYIKFLAHLQPLMEVFIGKIGSIQGVEMPAASSLNAASLVAYCAADLPEMVQIVVGQSDPTITIEEVKRQGKNPFKLATIVLEQIQQNRMIADFSDFFVQILPLMKAAAPKTEEPKKRPTTRGTRS